MYSVYRYLSCCFERLFISIFLTPVPVSLLVLHAAHISSPKCHRHRHLTLNGRMCRLTMYFSLFLFRHAVFSCLVFRFSVHHLLEISRSTISVWRLWSRHCATSRKIAGSIPDGVISIFHWQNPSGRTMALGSNQPLTEMNTRNISLGVKAAGA